LHLPVRFRRNRFIDASYQERIENDSAHDEECRNQSDTGESFISFYGFFADTMAPDKLDASQLRANCLMNFGQAPCSI